MKKLLMIAVMASALLVVGTASTAEAGCRGGWVAITVAHLSTAAITAVAHLHTVPTTAVDLLLTADIMGPVMVGDIMAGDTAFRMPGLASQSVSVDTVGN
jgi:hypothetical protein